MLGTSSGFVFSRTTLVGTPLLTTSVKLVTVYVCPGVYVLIWTLASSTLYVLSSAGTKKSTLTSDTDELILVYEAEITVADSVIGYYVRIASTTCYIFCSG